MKIILLACFIFCLVNSNGQSVILLEQDSVSQIYEDVDISNPNKIFSIDLFYDNNTNENISIHWKREFENNCPSEWDVTTSDQYYDYTPNINESVNPIAMTPVDTHFIIRQSVWPNQVAGCCDGKVLFYLEGDLNNPIDTGYFHIEINSNNCIINSTKEENLSSLIIFPNPVGEVLYLEDGSAMNEYQVFDSFGNLALKGSIEKNQIDVSSLEFGVYYVQFISNKEKATTKKLIKLE